MKPWAIIVIIVMVAPTTVWRLIQLGEWIYDRVETWVIARRLR